MEFEKVGKRLWEGFSQCRGNVDEILYSNILEEMRQFSTYDPMHQRIYKEVASLVPISIELYSFAEDMHKVYHEDFIYHAIYSGALVDPSRFIQPRNRLLLELGE